MSLGLALPYRDDSRCRRKHLSRLWSWSLPTVLILVPGPGISILGPLGVSDGLDLWLWSRTILLE